MLKSQMSLIALSLIFGGSALMADSFSTVEYVNVIRSTPVYSTIQEEVPSQKCYDVQEQVGGGTNNDVVGAVVGGALGGVLGNRQNGCNRRWGGAGYVSRTKRREQIQYSRNGSNRS
jgi:uncharacterized protein YcfJ